MPPIVSQVRVNMWVGGDILPQVFQISPLVKTHCFAIPIIHSQLSVKRLTQAVHNKEVPYSERAEKLAYLSYVRRVPRVLGPRASWALV